jgi:hypothetical protein
MRTKPLLMLACVCLLPLSGRAEETVVTVHAGETLFTLSDMMIGANMEDLHYQMVGGLDSQMLHGESFFEHSPTELAARKSQLDGFATVNGVWTAADGVVTVVVRPSDGTPWVETGLDGGQPPTAPSDAPGKDPGARLTSLEPAAPGAVATRGSFRFPAGEDRPASLIAHVHPNHSDNGWNWYSGYTVELDPQAQKVRLLAALRANKHEELNNALQELAELTRGQTVLDRRLAYALFGLAVYPDQETRSWTRAGREWPEELVSRELIELGIYVENIFEGGLTDEELDP